MERQTLPFAPGLRLNGNAMTEHGNEQPCNADLQSIMVGESVSVNPLVSLVANTNFDGFTTFPPRTCNKNVLQHCRKHKREEDYDGDNIPSKKKRLSKDAWVAQISTSNAGVPYMDREVLDLHSSFAGDNNSETSTVEMPCEEMEHTLWKQQSQRTLTLQDIENR